MNLKKDKYTVRRITRARNFEFIVSSLYGQHKQGSTRFKNLRIRIVLLLCRIRVIRAKELRPNP